MRAGDFYASSGVTLKDVHYDAKAGTIAVEIDAVEGESYTTQFIGTLADYDASSTPRTDGEGNELSFTRIYSNDVGPDLNGVTNKSVAELVTAILDPNREVDPSFLAHTVILEDGRVLSGRLVTESEHSLTVRTVDGEEHRIHKSQVDQHRSGNLSLMPEGFEFNIDKQQMADLLAYLSRLQDRVQYVPVWWSLGAFPNSSGQGFDRDFGSEAKSGQIRHDANILPSVTTLRRENVLRASRWMIKTSVSIFKTTPRNVAFPPGISLRTTPWALSHLKIKTPLC